MANYSGAIAHYKKLKETMLRQLLQDPSTKTITKEQLANAIVNNNKSVSSAEKRKQRTNQILSDFENAIFQDSSQYSHLVTKCQQAEQQGNNEVFNQAKNELKQLLDKNKEEIIRQATSGKLLYGVTASDYNTVFGQMKSVLIHSLISGKHLTLYNNSAIRIGGFVQEVMELEALREFFLKPNVKKAITNVHLTGSMTMALDSGQNVDSPMDLIISSLNDAGQAFNSAVSVSKNIDQYLNGQLSYNNINSFGVQSKSWNLTSSLRFYEIGHRTGLLNSFKANNPRSYTKIEKAIEFLSQTSNTLQALGPTNVLFRAGNQRFWMDEFLQSVTKNMSLIFSSSEKKYYNPTQLVGFSQVYINYKNTKNIQRKQYQRK